MLQIKKNNLENIFSSYEKVVLFGAGSLTVTMLEAYRDLRFEKKVDYIIDNDRNKNGKAVLINGKEILIVTIESFSCLNYSDYALLIMPVFMLDIVKHIDDLPIFHDVPTYIYAFVINMEREENFSIRHTEKAVIPKIIHYCWFGGNPFPEKYKRNVVSWRKYCPDYEIVEWNETNYDVNKNLFMRQSYERRRWDYVSDYARKDIIYEHGGIYLDTDVELINSIDDLLYNKFFIGCDDVANIASGAGFGAIKGNELVKLLRDDYDRREVMNGEGRITAMACGVYETALFVKLGYRPNNRFQIVRGGSIFPRQILCPISWIGMPDVYTEKTLSVHKYDDLLIDSKGKDLVPVLKKEIEQLMKRGESGTAGETSLR